MAQNTSSSKHLAAPIGIVPFVDMIVATIESDAAAFDTLDSKAGLLLGFGLLTIAELVGFLLLAAEPGHLGFHLPWTLKATFYVAAALLMCGGGCAMYALYPRGFSRTVPVSNKMLQAEPTVYDVVMSAQEVIEKNKAVLASKGAWTRFAAICIFAGLLSLGVVAILLFGSLT